MENMEDRILVLKKGVMTIYADIENWFKKKWILKTNQKTKIVMEIYIKKTESSTKSWNRWKPQHNLKIIQTRLQSQINYEIPYDGIAN